MFRKLIASVLLCILLFSFGACAPAEDPVSSGTDGTVSDSVEASASEPVSETDSVTDTDSEQETSSTEKLALPPPSSQIPSESELSDPEQVLAKGQYLVGLTDQKNQRILICDLAVKNWANDKAVVWQYKTYGGVAGIKFRDNDFWGEKVVIYCSGTRATILSYATKKVLLDTKNGPQNCHSVELLPNGVFVVAGSTGNEVRIFGAGKTSPSDSVTFRSAHGVLWDPKYNVLWIEGHNQLQAFRVTGTAENPKLEAVADKLYHPNTNIHDMAPVYGDPDLLLLTGGNGVVLFNKKTGEISYDYLAGGYLKGQTYVPGVGNFSEKDGVCVFTTIRSDTLTYKEWGTDQVGILVPVGNGRGKVLYRQAKSDAYYKVRVFNFNYQ